jgi:hypothetical protein
MVALAAPASVTTALAPNVWNRVETTVAKATGKRAILKIAKSKELEKEAPTRLQVDWKRKERPEGLYLPEPWALKKRQTSYRDTLEPSFDLFFCWYRLAFG